MDSMPLSAEPYLNGIRISYFGPIFLSTIRDCLSCFYIDFYHVLEKKIKKIYALLYILSKIYLHILLKLVYTNLNWILSKQALLWTCLNTQYPEELTKI